MYITFAAYPGAAATIDGAAFTVPQCSGLVDLAGRQFIRISGLRVMNSTEAGILADGTSDIVIEGNYVTNTGSSGIGVWSSCRVLVSGNTVERACSSGDQECISVAGTDSFIVSDNVVFDCRKEGICLKDGSSFGEALRNDVHHTDHVGIYVDAWNKHTFNIDVHRNLVHDAMLKSGIMLASEQGGQLENVRVINNISYGNAFDGLSISDCCPGASQHPIRNALIVNNTFTANGTGGWGGGIRFPSSPWLARHRCRGAASLSRGRLRRQQPSFGSGDGHRRLRMGCRNEHRGIRCAVPAYHISAEVHAADEMTPPAFPAAEASLPSEVA